VRKPRWTNGERQKVKEAAEKAKTYSELLTDLQKIFPQRSRFSLEKAVKRYSDWKGKKAKAEPTPVNQKALKMGEKKTEVNAMVAISTLTEDEKKFLKLVKGGPVDLSVLSDELLKKSKNAIIEMIDSLREKGYDVSYRREVDEKNNVTYTVGLAREPVAGVPVRLEGVGRDKYKILIFSDLGFGLKAQQPRLVATALEMGKQQEVNFAICVGDITGGKPTPGEKGDFLSDNFEDQVGFASKMPKMPFKIYFLNGPRDLSHLKKEGQNVARILCEAREDWRYEGDNEANFFIEGSKGSWKIKVMHIKKGSPYTKSDPIQVVAENFQEAINYIYRKPHRPNLLILGGLFATLEIPAKKPGDMQALSVPGLYPMTPSQKIRRKRGGAHELGYMIVTVKLDKEGNPYDVDYEVYSLTAYQITGGCPDSFRPNGTTGDISLTEEQKKILDSLKQRPMRYGELARGTGIDKSDIKKIVNKLRKIGYDIDYDKASNKLALVYDWKGKEFKPLPSKDMFVKTLKKGSFSDTHIGNQDARIDLIKKVYEIGEEHKVHVFTHTGDLVDGQDAYPGQEMELVQHGADAQLEKALEIWPDSKIPTIIIAGSSHEWVYWIRSGYNIVKAFARAKTNVAYIGGKVGMEGIKEINGVTIKLVHPTGGIPIGKSYRPQKWIESLVEEIGDTQEGVRVLVIGHLHISLFMLYKGIASFMIPCLEEQTWYLKSKGLNPWLGMWINEITLDKFNNVTRVRPKYISFEGRN